MNLLGLHHVRVRAADLSATESFAADFGLIKAAETSGALYMKTAGGDAYAYVVEAADAPGFVGYAVKARAMQDLDEAVERHGASPVRPLDGPGGGYGATLVDPNGFRVDIVTGIAEADTVQRDHDLRPNSPANRVRFGDSQHKRPLGPAHLYRLGHLGLFVRDFAETAAWCRETLGLIGSELYHTPEGPEHQVVGFFRLDRGEEWVDHHVLALMRRERADCHHISFEVQDFEAQFVAHRWLEKQGYESVWGVGRHPHGSHVFDVWRDPNGYRFETFSDTDYLQADRPTRVHDIRDVQMDEWSSDPPDRYFA